VPQGMTGFAQAMDLSAMFPHQSVMSPSVQGFSMMNATMPVASPIYNTNTQGYGAVALPVAQPVGFCKCVVLCGLSSD